MSLNMDTDVDQDKQSQDYEDIHLEMADLSTSK